MQRAFKGVWIPKEVWLDKSLGWSEKLLLVEIDSLDNDEGCWASNEYFAEFFNLSKDRISKLISSLKKKGYVTVDLIYKEGTKQIDKRVVKITDRYRRKQLEGMGENNDTPLGENAEDNNTSINNTDNIPYVDIVYYLNEKTDKKYRHTTKSTREKIRARWNDGFRLEDFKKVIDTKVKDWKHDPEMNKYLRPETLFGNKFEGYLNENTSIDKEVVSEKETTKDDRIKEIKELLSLGKDYFKMSGELEEYERLKQELKELEQRV